MADLKKSFLIGIFCASLFCLPPFAKAVCTDCINFEVSAPVPVLWTGGSVPIHTPDNLFSVIKFSDTSYTGYVAGSGGSYRMSASSLLGLNQNTFNATKVIDKGAIGNFDDCGAWIHSAEIISGNNVKTWYHAEGGGACNGTGGGTHIKSIAYATSNDGGATFTKPNYPNNVILTGSPNELAEANETNIVGVGDFSVVNRTVGGIEYYYLFYINKSKAKTGVARATVASGGVPGSWYKYYNGSFSQPGIGGIDSDVGMMLSGVSYNSSLDQFVGLIYSQVDGAKPAFSPDGINWTALDAPLVPDGKNFSDSPAHTPNGGITPHGFSTYRTIIGIDGSQDWTDTFYLYYLYVRPSGNFTKRFFLRSEVKMKVNSSEVSSPQASTELIRYKSSSTNQHWVTSALAVPAQGTWDFQNNGSLGRVFTSSGTGLVELSECTYSANHYVVSAGATCGAGQTKLRTIGWVYSPSLPQPVNTHSIYRCYVPATGSHFVSVNSNCDGSTVEGRLGYALDLVDTSDPTTTINSHPSTATNSNSASFTFSSNESGYFQCKLDAGAYATCTSPKSYANLSQGNHTFSVKAIDNAGNEDETPATYAWMVDIVLPNTTVTAVSAKPDSSQASFSFSSNESGSTFQCKLDTGSYAACTSPKSYTNLSQGSHTFSVRSVDAANNIDATPAIYSWTIDTILPNTTITSVTTELATASFSFSSNETGATFQCKLDTGSYATCASPKSYDDLTDGAHTFSVKAIDSVNNADTTPASYAWTVDPIIPNTTINTAITNIASATFSFSSSETNSTFQCKIDSESYADCVSPKSYSGLTQGSHTFSVRAKDADNVDATPAEYSWTIDTILPNTTIDEINAVNNSASFSFSSNGAGAIFQCKLDTEAYTDCVSPKSYDSLTNSTHTFSVKAIDQENGADTTPAAYTWTIESASPSISGISPSGNLSSGTTSATLSFSTNENATCKYSNVANTAYGAMTETFTTTGEKTHSKEISGLQNETSYMYFVRCQDRLGNTNSEDYSISFSVDNAESNHENKKKETPKRTISVSKKKITKGETLIERGKRFSKNSIVMLYFSRSGGGYYAPMKVKTNSAGGFSISYKIPFNKPKGNYSWYAVDTKTGKKSKVSRFEVK